MAVNRKVRARILEEWPTCRLCRKAPSTTIDHIWPRRYGGTDDEGNLQAACRPCNSRKGGILPPDGMLPLYGQLEKPPRVWWKPTTAYWLSHLEYFVLDLE